MRQAGRNGSERGKFLPLHDYRFALAQPRDDRVEDGLGRRRTLGEECCQGVVVDHEQAAVPQRADRGEARCTLENGHLTDNLARTARSDHALGATLTLEDLQFAVNDDVERVSRLSFTHEEGARRDGGGMGHRVESLEILFGQPLQQGGVPHQLLVEVAIRRRFCRHGTGTELQLARKSGPWDLRRRQNACGPGGSVLSRDGSRAHILHVPASWPR